MSLETRPVQSNTIGVTRAPHITYTTNHHDSVLSHFSRPRLFSVMGVCASSDQPVTTPGHTCWSPHHKRHVTLSQWWRQWWHQISWIIAQSCLSCPPCISDSAHTWHPHTPPVTPHITTRVTRRALVIRSSSRTSCDGWVEEGGGG